MSIPMTVAAHVALIFVNKSIEEAGFCIVKKIFFPKKKYENRLINIINKTIKEYEKSNSFWLEENLLPFYHSQELFEELNNFVLFKNSLSEKELLSKFKENTNILPPAKEELSGFYELFIKNINNDKELEKLFVEEKYKSKIFDIAKSINDLDKKITAIEKTLVFNPSKRWFIKQNQLSITDLGKRYSSDINFELSDQFIFEGLGRTNKFKNEVIKRLDKLLIQRKKINSIESDFKVVNLTKDLDNVFDAVFNKFIEVDFQSATKIPVETFMTDIQEIENITQELKNQILENRKTLENENNKFNLDNKTRNQIYTLDRFQNELENFKNFLEGTSMALANNPFLVIDGEAGIGKSHMLGDIVDKRINNGCESVFILGQQLMKKSDPWSQIFDILQINTNKDGFLETLNSRAKITGKRIVIFIDAVNEGQGRYFWPEFIRSFISDLKSYEWLGLVLTVRTPYKELIFEDDICDTIVSHTLYGFKNIEYEASKFFFKSYEIELPNVPLLHHEFQNPLFLKLFCEGIKNTGNNKVPDGLQGITSIVNFFLKSVNEVLSKPNNLDYPRSINLVEEFVDTLVKYQLENDVINVPYAIAYHLIDEIAVKYTNKKAVIERLISEGILSKNSFRQSNDEYQEVVYFAYEKFEDHLKAKHLLNYITNVAEEFKYGGKLYKYTNSEESIYCNRGLIDALSIQIPEKYEKELYELVSHLKTSYPIVESFVDSLFWRKLDSMNEKLLPYINETVLKYIGTYELFWETIISITAIPDHYFNSKFLHKNLIRLSMSDRDAEWTVFLKSKYSDESSVKRLIDWAWNENDKSYISDQSVELGSIALAWFHTSTNRQLRDSSTKALVCLLQERIDVLINVLKAFEGVNDPYVYERLFAVAYGCILRSKQKEFFVELSEYIYETVFKDKNEVYPHALLRDYARGVIEYTYYLDYDLSFDISLVRPPYKSELCLENIPSNKEIDERYKFDYKSDHPDYYLSQNIILNSMMTESGRGGGGYGDFGRYTFERALRVWNVNTDKLNNLAIEWIFEKYGYDVDKHGKYDMEIRSHGRSAPSIERIGKKYQWLAFYEMVARISDKFEKFEEYGLNRENKDPYQGPWSPYIRDIDPTMIIYKTGRDDYALDKEFWWESKSSFNWKCENLEWIKDSTDLPKLEYLTEVKDELNEEWLVLESYTNWTEPKKIGEERWDYPHKRFWSQVRSYIVHESELQQFKEWAQKQNFMGRWMPESSNRYEIFSREFYWSQAHKYFINNKYYDSSKWHDIIDSNSKNYIAKVNITAESFLWEEEFDKSKEDSINILKPSTNIFSGMNMKYGDREGEFLNCSNEVICFDPSVYNDTNRYLLIKKDPFLKFLKENDYKIVWTVLGEKEIIGGRSRYYERLLVNGVYFLAEDEVTGSQNIETT